MKKQIVILMVLICPLQMTHAQSIEPCIGNTSKGILDADDALYFNLQGLNLNSYDWSNPDVNCHINLMLENHHSAVINSTWGWVVGSLGLGGLAAAIPLSYFSDGLAPLYLVSVGGIAGGVYMFVKSSKQKKLRNYHMNAVSTYYRENKLN